MNATWWSRAGIAALVALAVVAQGAPVRADLAKVGEPAPTLNARDLQDRKFELSEVAYPGAERPRRPRSAVLLDFFSTSCPPCVKKLPELVRQHDQLRRRGIRVVLVALLERDENGGVDEDKRRLVEFLAANPLPFTVVVDPLSHNAKSFIYDGKDAVLPSMVVVDAQGIVRAVGRDLDDRAVARALDQVGRPVSAAQPAKGQAVLGSSAN